MDVWLLKEQHHRWTHQISKTFSQPCWRRYYWSGSLALTVKLSWCQFCQHEMLWWIEMWWPSINEWVGGQLKLRMLTFVILVWVNSWTSMVCWVETLLGMGRTSFTWGHGVFPNSFKLLKMSFTLKRKVWNHCRGAHNPERLVHQNQSSCK